MNKLTVYFEEPFWVRVFERIESGKIETCRIVFGAEPKDYEVYDFILENYSNLRFSKPINIDIKVKKHINPKRLHREIKKAAQKQGVGTKAQQAIKLEQESRKIERKRISKEQREKRKKLDFERKQLKKKEKKKGH